MFALTPGELQGRISDCGAGPAGFNAEATEAGHRITACDPPHRFSAADILRHAEETSDTPLATAREHPDRFVWREIESSERLGELRLATMNRFWHDFPAGLEEGRYRDDPLPHLRFGDGDFDLARC